MTDQNTTNETNCENFTEPSVSRYFRLVITTFILVVAFLGNIVVLRAIRRLPGRKPFIYLLVANLAAGELGQVILFPFLLYYEETWWIHGWPYGEFLCKVINPLHNVFLANVTYTLSAIAVYRCLMVYSPPRRKLSPVKTKSLFASFWCVGLAVAIPQSVARELMPCSNSQNECCSVNWDKVDKAAFNAYLLIWGVVVLYIPMITMIVAYAMVSVKIHRHINITENQPRKASEQSARTSCPECELQEQIQLQRCPGAIDTSDQNKLMARAARKSVVEMETNLLKMMYIIVVSFLTCYLPYHLQFVLYYYNMLRCWKYSGIFAMYALFVLSNLPSALHPLFYGTKSKFFARAFFRILSCKFNSNPADSAE